jgi:hypothetical protein
MNTQPRTDKATSTDAKDAKTQAPPPPQDVRARRLRNRVDETLPSRSLSGFVEKPVNNQASTLRLRNSFATIASGTFSGVLRKYCDIHDLTPAHPHMVFDGARFDALIVEGRIPERDAPWRRALLDIDGEGAALRSRLDAARKAGIPTVLWITDEDKSTPFFAHLMPWIDHIIGQDGPGVPSEKRIAEAHFVDVKAFNPMVNNRHQVDAAAAYLPFLVDGCFELSMDADRATAQALLKPMFDYNWWLTDSSYDLRNDDQKVDPVFRRRFVGSKRGDSMANPLKYASAYFLPAAMAGRRPAHARKRAWEAAASKTCVATDAPDALGDGRWIAIDNPETMARFCTWVADDPVGTAAAQHLAWRDAMSHHTYFDALEMILARIGVRPRLNAPRMPHVNIVIPTIRPDLIPFIFSNIDRQTYPNLSVTIVVNGVPISPEIQRLIDAHPKARVVSMPNDKSIGYCMNFGIDQTDSEYWAKMDDDDVYGDHYISDLMLQRRYVDFDVTGKAGFFMYSEETDTIHSRNFFRHDTPEQQIGGGTFLVKRNENLFPEDVRGYADTLFLAELADSGRKIIAGDPFNFVQVRRADRTSHTWTAAAHQLNMKGPQRAGLNFDCVLI